MEEGSFGDRGCNVSHGGYNLTEVSLLHPSHSLNPVCKSIDVLMEDSGIGTFPTSRDTSKHSPEIAEAQLSLKSKRSNLISHLEPRSKQLRTDVDVHNSTMATLVNERSVTRTDGRVRPQDGLLYSLRRTFRRSLTPLSRLGGRYGPITSIEQVGEVPSELYHLHNAVLLSLPQLLSMGIHPSVLTASIDRSAEFRFPGHLQFSSSIIQGQPVRIGDGAVLHLGEDSCAGATEFERLSAFSELTSMCSVARARVCVCVCLHACECALTSIYFCVHLVPGHSIQSQELTQGWSPQSGSGTTTSG